MERVSETSQLCTLCVVYLFVLALPCPMNPSTLFSSISRRAPLGTPLSLLGGSGASISLRAPLGTPLSLLGGCGAAGVRWANSKGGGSSSNGRDSKAKFLGVKRFGGEWVEPGHIVVRQRGVRVGVVESTRTAAIGRDHTVWALVPGYVKFWHHALKGKNYVEIVKSAPGVEPVEKYDIAHVRPWELPALDRLDRDARTRGVPPPALTDDVRAALEKHRDKVKKEAPSGGRGEGSWVAQQVAAATTTNA